MKTLIKNLVLGYLVIPIITEMVDERGFKTITITTQECEERWILRPDKSISGHILRGYCEVKKKEE